MPLEYVIGIDEVGRAAKRRASPSYIIGIDEVGRGSLAGPVTVAAAMIPRGIRFKRSLGRLKDSKALNVTRREAWVAYLKFHPRVDYAIASIGPRGIERMNITRAANTAALRAFTSLTKTYNLKPRTSSIYLDGGLFLGNRHGRTLTKTLNKRGTTRKEALKYADEECRRKSAYDPRRSAITMVRGDQKINAVKIASLFAKVHRDRLMMRLSHVFPQYGFEVHKGYGTLAHKRAIRRYGVSRVHRQTFLGKVINRI